MIIFFLHFSMHQFDFCVFDLAFNFNFGLLPTYCPTNGLIYQEKNNVSFAQPRVQKPTTPHLS